MTQPDLAPARLHAIYLRPSARTPVRSVPRARAVAGEGLEGDHARGGRRQVTLLDLGAWRAACAELGGDELDPGGRRANLVVEGLDLGAALGGELEVGGVRIEVVGETHPCQLMDDVRLGLMAALGPARRGGVYGRLLTSGELAVGDPVRRLR